MSLPPHQESQSEVNAAAEPISVDEFITPEVDVLDSNGQTHLSLSGDWQLRCIAKIDNAMRALEVSIKSEHVTIDLGSIRQFDTSGALVVACEMRLSKEKLVWITSP